MEIKNWIANKIKNWPMYIWVILICFVLYFITSAVFWLWLAGFEGVIRIVSGKEQAEQMAWILTLLASAILALMFIFGMIKYGFRGGNNLRYYK